jgi:hypothetical protein
LSLTLFERMPLNQLLAPINAADSIEDFASQLNLFN